MSPLTGSTPTLFIKVPVPSPESERSCICVFGISMLPPSTILIFHFGIVWYFITKIRQFKMHFNAHYIISCIVHIFVKSDMKIVCPTNKCIVLFIYAPEFNLLRD
jgi:hypothetical protein